MGRVGEVRAAAAGTAAPGRRPAKHPKHVLVTGASSGIGAAIAQRFAAEGAALTLLGRDRKKLARVAESLATGAPVKIYAADFARQTELSRTLRALVRDLTSLDALVHAAGMLAHGTPLEHERRAFDTMLQVNVHAAMEITRFLVAPLQRAGGTIVFINSSGVFNAQAMGPYIATKHALRGLTESLREELKKRGIRVTSIYPGRTATPMQHSLHRTERVPYHAESLVQPADIAALAAYAVNLNPGAELVDAYIRPRRTRDAHNASARRRKPS